MAYTAQGSPSVQRGSPAASMSLSKSGGQLSPLRASARSQSSPPGSPNHGSASKVPSLQDFRRRAQEAQETYPGLRARARGEKIHAGPLELRKSMAPRDCTSWVREDKRNNTHFSLDHPHPGDESPSKKKKRKKSPPKLWLPPFGLAAKAAQKEAARRAKAEKEGEAKFKHKKAVKPVENEKDKIKPWDSEHHIMVSRMNEEMQCGTREYFGRPKAKEMRPPPVREDYRMTDHTCGWNDDPLPPGEGRPTVFDTIGPYNRGGCKEQQVPSYWRSIKDWRSFSTPELGGMLEKKLDHSELVLFNARTGAETKDWITSMNGGKPLKVPSKRPPPAFIAALADAPADQSREYWRNWAEQHAQHPASSQSKIRWDDHWATLRSKANDSISPQQRQYFSVPPGATGYPTDPPRPRREPKPRPGEEEGSAAAPSASPTKEQARSSGRSPERKGASTSERR